MMWIRVGTALLLMIASICTTTNADEIMTRSLRGGVYERKLFGWPKQPQQQQKKTKQKQPQTTTTTTNNNYEEPVPVREEVPTSAAASPPDQDVNVLSPEQQTTTTMEVPPDVPTPPADDDDEEVPEAQTPSDNRDYPLSEPVVEKEQEYNQSPVYSPRGEEYPTGEYNNNNYIVDSNQVPSTTSVAVSPTDQEYKYDPSEQQQPVEEYNDVINGELPEGISSPSSEQEYHAEPTDGEENNNELYNIEAPEVVVSPSEEYVNLNEEFDVPLSEQEYQSESTEGYYGLYNEAAPEDEAVVPPPSQNDEEYLDSAETVEEFIDEEFDEIDGEFEEFFDEFGDEDEEEFVDEEYYEDEYADEYDDEQYEDEYDEEEYENENDLDYIDNVDEEEEEEEAALPYTEQQEEEESWPYTEQQEEEEASLPYTEQEQEQEQEQEALPYTEQEEEDEILYRENDDKIAEEWREGEQQQHAADDGLIATVQHRFEDIINDPNVWIVACVMGCAFLALVLVIANQLIRYPTGFCTKFCRCALSCVQVLTWPIRKLCDGSSKQAKERRGRHLVANGYKKPNKRYHMEYA